MIFSQNREEIRQFFIDVWSKYGAQQRLEPLEQIIANILREHPEYHALLSAKDTALERDYLPELGESNPFLHMGMHIAIQEQLATNRPAGIIEIYQSLLVKLRDKHEVEHRMLDCLGEMLWRAQRSGTDPDESSYLACLRKVAGMNPGV
ncbi:MAG: DUF1841 family protein [Gammaproteobacteria bacterium]